MTDEVCLRLTLNELDFVSELIDESEYGNGSPVKDAVYNKIVQLQEAELRRMGF